VAFSSMRIASGGPGRLFLSGAVRCPLDDQNVAGADPFRKGRHHHGERWFGPDGDPFPPQTAYALGGQGPAAACEPPAVGKSVVWRPS